MLPHECSVLSESLAQLLFVLFFVFQLVCLFCLFCPFVLFCPHSAISMTTDLLLPDQMTALPVSIDRTSLFTSEKVLNLVFFLYFYFFYYYDCWHELNSTALSTKSIRPTSWFRGGIAWIWWVLHPERWDFSACTHHCCAVKMRRQIKGLSCLEENIPMNAAVWENAIWWWRKSEEKNFNTSGELKLFVVLSRYTEVCLLRHASLYSKPSMATTSTDWSLS